MRTPTTSPRRVTQAATATAICYGLLVVTGGAVRLTGSGLGCPDWPTCTATHITPPASIYADVEFGNRMVTVAVTIISLVALGAALTRRPRRRDLSALAWAIVGGLVAQIVLGGLVVLFKLNPYLVALHFLLTLVMLAIALTFRSRSLASARVTRVLIGRDLLICSRLGLAALGIVVTLGTVVSGSGPHAGAKDAKRIAIAFRDAAELHSSAALFSIGLVLALLFALRQANAPGVVQQHARWLLEALAVQGVLGYTQYALHDAAGVVELHLAGATTMWWMAVSYYLSLHERAPEEAPATVTETTEAVSSNVGAGLVP